jgi:hypothetical protein
MVAYNIRSPTIYNIKKQKDQLQSFMASSDSVKVPSKVTYIETALWQGCVKVVYSIMFQKRTHDWAYNWKAQVFLLWNQNNFSDGWQQKFKDGHGNRKLNVSGEMLFTNVQTA